MVNGVTWCRALVLCSASMAIGCSKQVNMIQVSDMQTDNATQLSLLDPMENVDYVTQAELVETRTAPKLDTSSNLADTSAGAGVTNEKNKTAR